MSADYPPADATREQIRAWRDDRTREHNEVVEAADRQVEENSALGFTLRVARQAAERQRRPCPCGHKAHDDLGCRKKGCPCARPWGRP